MRSVIMEEPGKVVVEDRPMPTSWNPRMPLLNLLHPASAGLTCGPTVARSL